MTPAITIPTKTPCRTGTILRWAANALLLVSAVCLGWYLFVQIQARVYSVYEEHRLAAALMSLRRADRLPPPVNRGDFIGQLDIPRIGLHAIVLEGTDGRILRLGIGHIPGTALPGEPGNVSLAAHRDSFFRPLRHVRKNDEIRLQTLEGEHRYVVDWTRVVRPGDTRVLGPTGHPSLTLVTCYPFCYVGAAPDRFIVRAHQVPG